MKKLNLGRIIVILCTLCILTKCKTYANDEIQILDTRFTDTDIDQNNQSNIYFDSNGNYGYGLLFLGKQNNDIQTQTTLQIQNGDTITCNKQLRGYYSTNYGNFHLLPIDSETFQQIRQGGDIPFPAQNSTSFTGGLFYDCHNGDTSYNGVYGHIKWTIGDFGNTQEIRAGIDKETNTWKSESPLKIVLHEGIGPNRALSGDARDSIGKRSRIIASFSLVNKIKIVIPDEYFYPNTAIYNENRDEIRFNDVGNNGYGLFFLGTGIQGSYNITNPDNDTITCTTQLNGYYTISFTDFGMFPLDQSTLSLVQNLTGTKGVSQSGGLYTNCTIRGTTYTTGVYGYIRWTYGMNGSKNIHEIRAGVDSGGHRKTPSPLEIIYSENFWNVYRSLSGNFHSSLIKNSVVENRFFGDMGLYDRYGNNIQAVGTLNDHHYFILYDDYSSDQMKIYTKSSMAGSKATIKLTGYDINGQQVSLSRNSQIDQTLEDNKSNFGFYGLYLIDFPNDVGHKMRSGTINVTITNPAITFMNSGAIRSKTMDFLIQSETPKITITRDPENDICATGITVSITATENATISYHITDSVICDPTVDYDFTTYSGPLSFTNDSYNNKYICIKAVAQNGSPTAYQNYQITNIDTQGPMVNFTNRNVNECTSITRSASARDTCAGVDSYSFSSTSFGNDQRYNRTSNDFYLTINDLGNTGGITKTQTLTVKDNFGHETTISQNITIRDVVPTVHNKSTDTINIGLQSGEYNFGNIFTNFDAKEGICPAGDLTGILNSCTDNAIGSILTGTKHNELLIRPSTNQQRTNGTCTIVFIDNEQSKATGYVTFLIDTMPPTITIQNLTNAHCARSRTVKTTLDETGTILYYTGTSESCDQNGPYILGKANTKTYSLVFTDESDIGTYVCVKAIDLAGNINYSGSAVVTGIDRTPPTFNISGNFEGNIYGYPDLYECETGFAEIINAQDSGCFRNSPISYSWDNSTFAYNTGYSKYSENTATRDVKVKAQDYGLNQSDEKTITFVRRDRQIYFSGQDTGDKTKTIHLSDMIDEVTVPNLIDAFNVTGRGSCETIVVTEGTCTNSTMNLDLYSLTITPEDDRDEQGTCEVTFKDCDQSGIKCDNILTGIISFRVKTKDYFVVLESGHEYSKGHIKNKDNYIDYEKISLDVTNDSGGRFNLSGKYEIGEIRRDNSLLEDSRPEDTKLNIETKINYDDLDYSLCPLSGNFKIILDTGFITDPAGNPSEWKEIITDQSYELRPHICVSGNSNNIVNNNTFEYTEGKIRTGFEMIIYVTTGVTLSPGTGDILCTGEQNCPGFSCSQTGIVGEGITLNPLSTCNNGSEVYGFNKYYKLRIDPNGSVDEIYPAGHIYSGEKRFEWTGCKIQITTGDCTVESYTNINLKTKTSPYKFGSYGFEDFYDDELGAAIASGGGDNGFFFYMSNPQFVNRPRGAGLVGNINYEMDFSTGVADEFYHIEGTGIVNGYQESLKIKRPTFNYANPRGYLFNFPYYDSPDENY